MKEASEINGDGKQEKNRSPSINQSSESNLVENKNLKELLEKNQELKKEYDGTIELVEILKRKPKLEIKTLDELNSYSKKIHDTEKIAQISRECSNLISEIQNFSDYIAKVGKATRYYKNNINKFEDHQNKLQNMGSVEYNVKCLNQSASIDDARKYLTCIKINYLNFIYNIYSEWLKSNFKFDDDFSNVGELILNKWNVSQGNGLGKFTSFVMPFFTDEYLQFYLSDTFKIYVKSGLYISEFNKFASHFIKSAESEIILVLLKKPGRYCFFLQWHKMLYENLPPEGQQGFYHYLKSCRGKLQNEKDNYKIFNRQVRNLTGIFIFGIIASTTVLTINLLEIYAATWFFWFGIVGVVLTVAVGIRLFFCLKENWNYLQKLTNDLQQEGKTVQNKINEIDRAIDVYDLDKIRNFKEPKTEKISTISMNENNKIEEINTDDPSNAIKLKPINMEENINNL